MPSFISSAIAKLDFQIRRSRKDETPGKSPARRPTTGTCLRCKSIDFYNLAKDRDDYYNERTRTDNGITRIYSTYNPQDWEFELGTLESVTFTSTCPLCPMLKYLLQSSEFEPDDIITIVPEFVIHRIEPTVSIYHDPSSGTRENPSRLKYARILSANKKVAYQNHLEEAPKFPLNTVSIKNESDHQGSVVMMGREVPQTLDFSRLKQWAKQCSDHHGDNCKPRRDPRLVDISLIDVETRTVVPYPTKGCDYLCLSYVWGNVEQNNHSHVLPPGSLPKTIEDSITATKSLGKQYLWVDSVCINPDEVEKQIALMSSIYRGAWATIVAVEGDSANAGLSRLASQVGDHPKSFSADGVTFVPTLPTLRQQIERSVWGTRAWTLQEHELSPRCFFFTKDQVHFDCSMVQCCESIEDPVNPFHKWNNTGRLLLSISGEQQKHVYRTQYLEGPGHWRPLMDWASLSNTEAPSTKSFALIYYEIVYNYTKRRMKYDTDSLNAISAMLEALSEKTLDRGFHWGLPLNIFAHALTWNFSDSARRREGFPSWSWTAWEGNLERGLVMYTDRQRETVDSDKEPFISFSVFEGDTTREIYAGTPSHVPDFEPHIKANIKIELEHKNWHSNMHQLLWTTGIVVRPTLNSENFSLVEESPPEEHVYHFQIGDHRCELTCNNQSVVDFIKSEFGKPLHILGLHVEVSWASSWYWECLLLKWDGNVAYRVGAVKFRFPCTVSICAETLASMNLARMTFALG